MTARFSPYHNLGYITFYAAKIRLSAYGPNHDHLYACIHDNIRFKLDRLNMDNRDVFTNVGQDGLDMANVNPLLLLVSPKQKFKF